MSIFAKGWKPDLAEHIEACRLGVDGGEARCDEHNPRYADRHGERFGARAAKPPAYDGVFEFCDVRDQIFSSACVGFAITGATGARLRKLRYNVGRFAPLVPYSGARQKEGIYKNKPLPDEGCHPYLAMAFVKQYGLVVEGLWPFLSEDYLKKVTQEVPFDVLLAASQFRVSSFSRIEDTGEARVEACKAALLADHPVLIGMQVGAQFEAYRKGLGPVGVETKNTGGHMTFLTGYEEDGDVFTGCNSWGLGYGDGGRYRIHRDKLTHSSTSDLYDFAVATP